MQQLQSWLIVQPPRVRLFACYSTFCKAYLCLYRKVGVFMKMWINGRDFNIWTSQQYFENFGGYLCWVRSFQKCFNQEFACSSWFSWEQVCLLCGLSHLHRLLVMFSWKSSSKSCCVFLRLSRSPLADPKSKGMICGLTLSSNEKDLALLYLAAVQSIAYGTRHIIEHCNAHGHKVGKYFLFQNEFPKKGRVEFLGKFIYQSCTQCAVSLFFKV